MTATSTGIELDDIDVGDQVLLQDSARNVAEGIVGGDDTGRWITAFGTTLRFAERSRKRGLDVAVGDPTEWNKWRGVKGVRVVGHTSTLV
jgi:hypothetical protein